MLTFSFSSKTARVCNHKLLLFQTFNYMVTITEWYRLHSEQSVSKNDS